MKIKIAYKWIGDKCPVFTIAEGGINHDGSIKIAKKIISKAKQSGADAIKFQTFKASDLASPKSKFLDIFKKLELDDADFGELSDYSKSQGIIFFSTPFSNEAVDTLSRLDVPAFKIASGDLTNIPLIRYVASKKKPIIISTGMANLNEIQTARKAILSTGNNKIIIMHSVSSYPTPPYEANLNAIKHLKEKFPYPIGYSDNGEGILVPLISVVVGAKLIEKHFTINKKLKGPDHSFSANPAQFTALVEQIRLVEKMLGDGIKCCQPSELENRIAGRRSITANISIEKGTKIKPEMVTIKRPATGIEPKYLRKVIGKIALKRIDIHESIKWNDIRSTSKFKSS